MSNFTNPLNQDVVCNFIEAVDVYECINKINKDGWAIYIKPESLSQIRIEVLKPSDHKNFEVSGKDLKSAVKQAHMRIFG